MKLKVYSALFFLLMAYAPAYVTVANQQTNTAAKPEFFTDVSSLLQKHVRQGQVNYTLLKQHQKQLASIVNRIAVYDLRKASAAEKKAFYLNAYNMLVWQQVMQHYPLTSVMDVPGFFDMQTYKVAGEMLTLNELEKQKLVIPYKDARIHFALVCAAKSCPPLLDEAYIPAKVEAQLEAQTKQILNSDLFIRVQPKTKQVQLSEIFKWYKQDFLKEAPSLITYVNVYRKSKLQPARVNYYTYDWTLNDSKF